MSLRLYESKSLATIRKSVMEKLFLGISNHVVCLNKKTGIQVWKTKLKSSGITNVYYEDGNIFAYSGGHLFCLDAVDGSINWENPLKGFGYSTCIIASEHQKMRLYQVKLPLNSQSPQQRLLPLRLLLQVTRRFFSFVK